VLSGGSPRSSSRRAPNSGSDRIALDRLEVPVWRQPAVVIVRVELPGHLQLLEVAPDTARTGPPLRSGQHGRPSLPAGRRWQSPPEFDEGEASASFPAEGATLLVFMSAATGPYYAPRWIFPVAVSVSALGAGPPARSSAQRRTGTRLRFGQRMLAKHRYPVRLLAGGARNGRTKRRTCHLIFVGRGRAVAVSRRG